MTKGQQVSDRLFPAVVQNQVVPRQTPVNYREGQITLEELYDQYTSGEIIEQHYYGKIEIDHLLMPVDVANRKIEAYILAHYTKGAKIEDVMRRIFDNMPLELISAKMTKSGKPIMSKGRFHKMYFDSVMKVSSQPREESAGAFYSSSVLTVLDAITKLRDSIEDSDGMIRIDVMKELRGWLDQLKDLTGISAPEKVDMRTQNVTVLTVGDLVEAKQKVEERYREEVIEPPKPPV